MEKFRLKWKLSDRIGAIEDILSPDAKITVIARFPDNDNSDVVFTSDTPDGIQEVLDRMKSGVTT
jgi:hypothetical protein